VPQTQASSVESIPLLTLTLFLPQKSYFKTFILFNFHSLEKFEPEADFIKLFDLGLRILVNPSDILHFKQIMDIAKVEVTLPNNLLDEMYNLESMVKENVIKSYLSILTQFWKHLQKQPKSLGWVID